MGGARCGALGRAFLTISCYPLRHTAGGWRDMKTIKRGTDSEVDQAGRWRHLVHRHGSNLLGGVMLTVMLYAVVLTVLAS
jgi:hypothetical protein